MIRFRHVKNALLKARFLHKCMGNVAKAVYFLPSVKQKLIKYTIVEDNPPLMLVVYKYSYGRQIFFFEVKQSLESKKLDYRSIPHIDSVKLKKCPSRC